MHLVSERDFCQLEKIVIGIRTHKVLLKVYESIESNLRHLTDHQNVGTIGNLTDRIVEDLYCSTDPCKANSNDIKQTNK